MGIAASSEAAQVASRVVAACGDLGASGFAYGQGSVFTGFTADSDLDIVIIWDRDAPPPPEHRPATRLSDPGTEPRQFHDAAYGLDKMLVAGWQVDLAHYTRTQFDSWCDQVASGDGWQEHAWPQPLHAVAGFVYGTVLADPGQRAANCRQTLRTPSTLLASKATATLERELPEYAEALRTCARTGDGWLFHSLATPLVKRACVAWFAAEGHYLPFPKHLHRWIRHLGLDAHRARLERRIWETSSLDERRRAVIDFVEQVLATGPASSPDSTR